MDNVLNIRLFTLREILKTIHENKTITFESQDVYKRRQSFNECMKFLERNNFIKKRVIVRDGGFRDGWVLTWDGTLAYEEWLRGLK